MRGQVYTKICGLVLRFERRSRTAHVSRDLWFGEFGLGDLGGLANKIAGSSSLDHVVGGVAKDGEMATRPARKFCCTDAVILEI